MLKWIPSTWEMLITPETQWRSQGLGKERAFHPLRWTAPFTPIKVKGFGWLKTHFAFTYLLLSSDSGAARLMLYIFFLSLILHIFIDKESQREIRRQFKAWAKQQNGFTLPPLPTTEAVRKRSLLPADITVQVFSITLGRWDRRGSSFSPSALLSLKRSVCLRQT